MISDAVIIALAIPVAGAVTVIVKAWIDFILARRLQSHTANAADAGTIEVMGRNQRQMQQDISSLQADARTTYNALRQTEQRADEFKELADKRLIKLDGYPARIETLERALRKAGILVPEDTDTDEGKAKQDAPKDTAAAVDTVSVRIDDVKVIEGTGKPADK